MTVKEEAIQRLNKVLTMLTSDASDSAADIRENVAFATGVLTAIVEEYKEFGDAYADARLHARAEKKLHG